MIRPANFVLQRGPLSSRGYFFSVLINLGPGTVALCMEIIGFKHSFFICCQRCYHSTNLPLAVLPHSAGNGGFGHLISLDEAQLPPPPSEYRCPAAGVETTKDDSMDRSPLPPALLPPPAPSMNVPLALDSCSSIINWP